MKGVKAGIPGALSTLALTASLAHAQTQGITDDEILIGQVGDLSGPAANGGLASMRAIQMRFDDVNAAGGIHGRLAWACPSSHRSPAPHLALQDADRIVQSP